MKVVLSLFLLLVLLPLAYAEGEFFVIKQAEDAVLSAQSKAELYDTHLRYEQLYVQSINASQVGKMLQDPQVLVLASNDVYFTQLIPNDTSLGLQYAHNITDAFTGWNRTTGNQSIIIAIIDTGVEWNHSDLADNIWNNTDEDCSELTDLDSNGYFGDCRGYDFVGDFSIPDCHASEDCSTPDNDPADVEGHGTHVAGIAGAVLGNGLGVAGSCGNCSIMPLRAGYKPTSGAGQFYASHLTSAINYAVANGADIISMSLGGTSNPGLETTITNALNAGVLVIAAAGNSNSNVQIYPAAYSNVISVGSTDSSDDRSSFSNYGSWVDVSAPGTSIYSTTISNSYGYKSGTSMATPYLSGALGLYLSLFPALNFSAAVELLNQTGDEPNDANIGMRVNVENLLDRSCSPFENQDWIIDEPVNCTGINVSITGDIFVQADAFFNVSTIVADQIIVNASLEVNDSSITGNISVNSTVNVTVTNGTFVNITLQETALLNLVNSTLMDLVLEDASWMNASMSTVSYVQITQENVSLVNITENISSFGQSMLILDNVTFVQVNVSVVDGQLELVESNLTRLLVDNSSVDMNGSTIDIVLISGAGDAQILGSSMGLNTVNYSGNITITNSSLNITDAFVSGNYTGDTNNSVFIWNGSSYVNATNVTLNLSSTFAVNANFTNISFVSLLQSGVISNLYLTELYLSVFNFSLGADTLELVNVSIADVQGMFNVTNASIFSSNISDIVVFDSSVDLFAVDSNFTNITIQNHSVVNFTNVSRSSLVLNGSNITVYSDPRLLSTTLLNQTYQVEQLALNFSANFSRVVTDVYAVVENVTFNFSDDISGTLVTTSLVLPNYGALEVDLFFVDDRGYSNNYTVNISAQLNISGSSVNDSDGDGLNNSVDTLFGSNASVQTSFSELVVLVNESDVLNQSFSAVLEVNFSSANQTIVSFDHNFSSVLNLTNVSVRNMSEGNNSQVLVRGLTVTSKTVYLDLLGNTSQYGSLCIVDREVVDFSQISINCTGTNELYVQSIPFTGTYNVSYLNSSNTTLVVAGLNNSGLRQECSEEWSCSSWSSCSGGSQTRTCTDANSCGTYHEIPVETQSCSSGGSGGGGSGGSGSSGSSSGGSVGIAYEPINLSDDESVYLQFRRYYNASVFGEHIVFIVYTDGEQVSMRLIEQNNSVISLSGDVNITSQGVLEVVDVSSTGVSVILKRSELLEDLALVIDEVVVDQKIEEEIIPESQTPQIIQEVEQVNEGSVDQELVVPKYFWQVVGGIVIVVLAAWCVWYYVVHVYRPKRIWKYRYV